MANKIADRIRREIDRDQQRLADEAHAALAIELYARDGYIPAMPATPTQEAQPRMTTKTHERVGRFYLVKHTGWYGLVRVDGTGDERWCANKKAATATAWRITSQEGEAERRQARTEAC